MDTARSFVDCFWFSNANVFLVFSIKHVHIYRYENWIIINCLLEMMLVVHGGIVTLISKLNWHTSTIVMVIVLQSIQLIKFLISFFYYWLSLNLKFIYSTNQLKLEKMFYFGVNFLVCEINNLEKYK